MKKTKLIETLHKNDLNGCHFGIYIMKDGSFAYAPTNSKPYDAECFIGRIGGNMEIRYSKRYISECIDDMMEAYRENKLREMEYND